MTIPPDDITWHSLAADVSLEQLRVNVEQGLDNAEVAVRQKRYGLNQLTPKTGKNPFLLFLSQFNQALVYILLISGSITAFLGEWVDASVIFGVVLINAIVGFIQESNALKAIAALARSLSVNACVLREGERRFIAAEQLVPGDIIFLQSGDKVPADVRLIQCRELQIDEAVLTGESLPVVKQNDVLAADVVLAERTNLAYSGTLVTYGTATCLVIATGDHTEIGRINQLIASADALQTPLTRKIDHFSNLLMWVIIDFAVLAFLVGRLRGESMLDMFMAAVALAVGAIPEGLPAAMTITLAIGVSRMAKRNAIVRKLPAVETLGSTTVICSDKTGTLTQNQMTVQAIYAGNARYSVDGVGYAPEGIFSHAERVIDPGHHPALQECLRAGLLCNDARLLSDCQHWFIEGDPTEGALLVAATKAGLMHDETSERHPRIDAIPFESQQQFMATLHHNLAADAHHFYLKGAVESILLRCQYGFDATLQSKDLHVDAILHEVEEMTSQGMRVLAFARGELSHEDRSLDGEDISTGLTFIGLQGMIDPPRPEAMRAVRACHRAGIAVKMITGDHVGTATAIASQIGLQSGGVRLRALSGSELERLSDGQLEEVAPQTDVFARVAPEQKLRLVRALQACGHVVAMTGDGVNDAPALKQADIGVAMGMSGTEVAKETADMVLTDDDFATLEAAVEEGRGVYDNLIKFITWTLPTNLGEGLVILVAILAAVPLPILPVQILWINMTTAVFLGLMLAFEPKEPGLMRRKPRSPDQPILTRALVFRVCLVGLLLLVGSFGLFEFELAQGAHENLARTVAVNVFVFGELFYLFNCRSFDYSMFTIGILSNLWVLGGVALMIFLQLLYTYLPVMNMLFQSSPLGIEEWALILVVGLLVYGVVGVEKRLRRALVTR